MNPIYTRPIGPARDEPVISITAPNQLDPSVSVPISFPLPLGPAPGSKGCVLPVSIRRFTTADASLLFDAARESIEHLCRWMTWCRPDYSIADSQAFILKSAQDWDCDLAYSFAAYDERDGTFLGSVGLSHVHRSHRFANLGYWVRASRVGSGIATKITLLAATFALQKLGLNRVEILVPSGNIASQRVAQKAGAKFEGILRKRLILHNQPTDAVLYSIVGDDLPSLP